MSTTLLNDSKATVSPEVLVTSRQGSNANRPVRLDAELLAMRPSSLLIRKPYEIGHRNHDVPPISQYNGLNEADIVSKCVAEEIPLHALEHYTQGPDQAVALRRRVLAKVLAITGLSGQSLAKLPHQNYNWDLVVGSCCENAIGYMPVPVGVAGPVLIDSKKFFIPMATTEGALIASTNRGCKAINNAGGVTTNLTDDGITRGPCVQFASTERAAFAKNWISSRGGQVTLRDAFENTSHIAKLRRVNASIAGRSLYIRFKATTGDAMGMNMISKGVENALRVMSQDPKFEDMQVISLSGNYCTDKKASALNWIEGRGKSVVAEAVIPQQVVQSVLKCTVEAMVRINNSKNLVGSAMAGVIGGYNAHAANIVAAIFIATGQDPAQVVESANCITLMESNCVDNSLRVSVTMPSLEVGTVGGGTVLEPQSSMLEMLGVAGAHPTETGRNAQCLASIIAAATLAGEVSLCAALTSGDLVNAHLNLNRASLRKWASP